jgi:hypothetical protein
MQLAQNSSVMGGRGSIQARKYIYGERKCKNLDTKYQYLKKEQKVVPKRKIKKQ